MKAIIASLAILCATPAFAVMPLLAIEIPHQAPRSADWEAPLSADWKDQFTQDVSRCWATGAVSTGVQNTIIEIAFDMTPDGGPVSGSVRLVGFSGGSAADADAAFQAARRALLRCSGAGYDLPREQYDQWQRVILTVDPTVMRQP